MAGGEESDRGWDGWIASLTPWTWIWVSSGSWWWTGKPGVLQSMGSQRVRHDWVTEQLFSSLENLEKRHCLVLQRNTQDWSHVGLTVWISLQSKGLSKVFSNTAVQKHQFFGAQPSLSNSHWFGFSRIVRGRIATRYACFSKKFFQIRIFSSE